MNVSAPKEYVTGKYVEYQKRYAEQVRHSDIVLTNWIYDTIPGPIRVGMNVLDIGCHNGNHLIHMKKVMPGMNYYGGDLFDVFPDVEDIEFDIMDVRNLPFIGQFHIVIQNAVLHRFDDAEYHMALESISRSLNPGGWFFAFDWFTPFDQELSIVEKSPEHPAGLNLHVRPYSQMNRMLADHGFGKADFWPFAIPIDLDKPVDEGDMRTYTVRSDTGRRLNFRGSLYQPWCHMRAQKI